MENLLRPKQGIHIGICIDMNTDVLSPDPFSQAGLDRDLNGHQMVAAVDAVGGQPCCVMRAALR